MDKDLRIARAVGELVEATEFVMSLWKMDFDKAVQQIKSRYPEFSERFEAMENVDEEDFLRQFAFWVLNKKPRQEYSDIWEEVKHAAVRSPAAQRLADKVHLMRQIEEILKESDSEAK